MKNDLEKYGIDENELKVKTKTQAKKYIKENIYKMTFEELKDIQKSHSKIKNTRSSKCKDT